MPNYDKNGDRIKGGKPPQERKTFKRPTQNYDTSELFTPRLCGMVVAIMQKGGAIRFGLTRDGGALSLGLYGMGEPVTEYFRPGDNVEDFLEYFLQEMENNA